MNEVYKYDKRIEVLINNPFNTSIIGYTSSRTNSTTDHVNYFIDIKNNIKKGSEKFFIKESEVKGYEGIISRANHKRADKQETKKRADKVLKDTKDVKDVKKAKDFKKDKKIMGIEGAEKIIEVECSRDIGDVIRDIEEKE